MPTVQPQPTTIKFLPDDQARMERQAAATERLAAAAESIAASLQIIAQRWLNTTGG